MKLLLLNFLLFFNLYYAQELNASHMTEIAQHEFADLDGIMISRFGFKRVEDIEDVNQKVYTNDNDNTEKLMVITVIKNPKACSNILSIVNGSAARITRLKEELPKEGYQYAGKKKMSEDILVSQFTKENMTVSVTDHVTGIGAYQILLTCR
ncbi:hypothetical protein [Chryseobacterium wangxinyae]|uniref:hypothetical protein n=1 Tax=Chryseobacterium sp. CY353 TaxID=2997334 RepID=UPI002270F52F|nr:hypothetical protein [Chryseobacterium sp. CY353]MCY0969218.1 hypothetical protein [Chryseobacterium sp. CY353]